MRIVSLVPNGTEILFALGAGDMVVGVSHECDYPEEARRRPVLTGSALRAGMSAAEVNAAVSAQVGGGESLYTLDETRIAELAPDVIVTQQLCPVCAVSTEQVDGAVRPLPRCPEVVSLDPKTLGDVFADIRRVGELTGRTEEAAALVAGLERRLEAVRAAVAGRTRPRVLALEWLDPPFAGGHWVPEMIEIAGGTDVAGQPGGHSQRLTWNQIAAADPDVIVAMPCGFDEAGAREQIAAVADRPEWRSLRAVRTGRVHAVDANGCFSRPGPRLVDGIERLAEILHDSRLTAKVPFDDRRNLEARLEDLSPLLVRRFLHDVGSDLVNQEPPFEDRQIYRLLNLVVLVNTHEVPRNVALLFFHEDPDRFFPGARTEVVRFSGEGDLLQERVFRGPIPYQIKSALEYLDSIGGTFLQKVPGQAEVEKTVPYPYEAMEEALVNAFYHRSYESPPEPVKVYLYPDRLEVISYPGPVPGIQPKHFQPGESIPPVPARNRRIGDFLKELRLAERRGTGIPKIQREMRQNGSPEARFDFDDERTYFRVTLPIHPRYLAILAKVEAANRAVFGQPLEAGTDLDPE